MTNINMTNYCEKDTLKYLTNPIYKPDVRQDNKNLKTDNVDKEDKRFYRKRILAMTRELFKKDSNNEEINKSFENYIFCLISNFKMTDKKDIIQSEYNDLDLDINDENLNVDLDEMLDNANQNMMIHKKEDSTLDGFVISNRDKLIKQEAEILPSIKQINLNDTTLKTKGVKNKKGRIKNKK